MKPNDGPPSEQDKYARESFTFRRMARWQIVGLIIVLLLMILGFIWLG
jgi:hypothetical protein